MVQSFIVWDPPGFSTCLLFCMSLRPDYCLGWTSSEVFNIFSIFSFVYPTMDELGEAILTVVDHFR